MIILIPMAGNGSRFKDGGYKDPKPFIDVNGSPMIHRVVENLNIQGCSFVLVAQCRHVHDYSHVFSALGNQYKIKIETVSQTTEGTACTVLKARKQIDNDEPLIIANSDQLIDIDLNDFVADAQKRNLDGSILTFIDADKNPKWSFAALDTEGYVTRVKEKEAISRYATVGVYYFRSAKTFINSAIDMIVANDRVNGEFYTCPVYNYLIADDYKVGIYNIDQGQMHGIGTPEDLTRYLALPGKA